MRKFFLFVLCLIVIFGIASVLQRRSDQNNTDISNDSVISGRGVSKNMPAEEIIATNLDIPWAIAFLPASPDQGEPGSEGSMLVTERSGSLLKIENGKKSVIAKLPIKHIGEGGLLGLALDPNFESNRFIYLYYTYTGSGNDTLNRVSRYKFENNKLSDLKILVDKIPGAPNHNGGRIKFGPDGFLYITTGDAGAPSRAQDRHSLAGKILRVTKDGKAPTGNPFGTLIYSYGHRNSQGLALDDSNRLWSTEHGRSGIQSGFDELNLIEPGKNYGWPTIQGNETRTSMKTPVVNSENLTWAPAGVVFLPRPPGYDGNGSIIFGGLRGSALYEYKIDEGKVVEHLQNKYGRIRDVVLGPDGAIYITTSNRDGRGTVRRNDDKIIKINPAKLSKF